MPESSSKMQSVESRPVPDPTLLTTQQLLREVGAAREVIETRLGGMDKAIELLQAASDRYPQFVRAEVKQLQELHEEKFRSIAIQFMERDKRTEQLSLADKTAIAAALQAQKEAAGAQNESNAAANAKMENSFAKLIDQNQALLLEVRRNTEAQINDLKSRLDKGEGKTSVSDPAVAEGIRTLSAMVKELAANRDTNTGKEQGIGQVVGYIVGAVGVLAGLAAIVAVAFKH